MDLDQAARLPTATGSHRLLVVPGYDEVSIAAADAVADVARAQPAAAITLPTGDTPRGMYDELVRRIRARELDFSGIHFFCLDDYLGKGVEDETSLTAWLDGIFLTPAGLAPDHVHFMPALADDPAGATREYEAEIRRRGGLKLAVVGLGPNGHVGFNEPGSPVDSRTRVVDLTEESRNQNAAYYDAGEIIPHQAMTMGLGTILEAESIVLIVSGQAKAGILKDAIKGPITADVPGSFLRTAGDRLTVIADREAASALGRSTVT